MVLSGTFVSTSWLVVWMVARTPCTPTPLVAWVSELVYWTQASPASVWVELTGLWATAHGGPGNGEVIAAEACLLAGGLLWLIPPSVGWVEVAPALSALLGSLVTGSPCSGV